MGVLGEQKKNRLVEAGKPRLRPGCQCALHTKKKRTHNAHKFTRRENMASRPGAGSGRQPPMRLSAVFVRMMIDCPHLVRAYGACVAAHLDDLRKDACAAEFAAMKQCSLASLSKLRAARAAPR